MSGAVEDARVRWRRLTAGLGAEDAGALLGVTVALADTWLSPTSRLNRLARALYPGAAIWGVDYGVRKPAPRPWLSR